MTSLAVDPSNPQLVYVGIGGFGTDVYRNDLSGNAGWTVFNNQLPGVPVDSLILSSDGATLYAGTDIGVYSTATSGANWSRFGTGLPYVQVKDLQLQTYGTTTYLAIATYGRGVWIIDPPTGGSPPEHHGHKHDKLAAVDSIFADLPIKGKRHHHKPGWSTSWNPALAG